MSKRLFLGLELPSDIREELARIDPHVKRLHWIAPRQMHLTLGFLGEMDSAHEERLRESLAPVRVPPFFLAVTGVGTFGGDRPSVVWAGLGKGHPHLFALRQHTQDAVLRAELEPDLKPFHAHITLGRARGVSRAMLKPFLREYKETEFGLWKVDGFALFSSQLSPEGSTYSVEMRWQF